jgi:hypothetical protein
MNTLSMAHLLEPMLWLLLAMSYARFQPKDNCLYFRLYLVVCTLTSALSLPMFFLLESSGIAAKLSWPFVVCTQIYWWGAILAAGFAIATLRSILKRLLISVPWVQRVFLLVFQWLLVASCFVILERMVSAARYATFSGELERLADGLSMMQLFLLLPLLPVTFMVRRSLRSHFQDVMVGLGVLATLHVVLATASHSSAAFSSGLAGVSAQIIILATQVFWICAFAIPQRQGDTHPPAMDALLRKWSRRPGDLDQV